MEVLLHKTEALYNLAEFHDSVTYDHEFKEEQYYDGSRILNGNFTNLN